MEKQGRENNLTIHSLITLILSGITSIIALFFAIPVIGRLLHWLWNIVLTAVWGVVGLFGVLLEAILSVFGVQLKKKLRICVVILRDEDGKPVIEPGEIIEPISKAVNTFKAAANVRIVRSGLPLNGLESSQKDQVDESWVQINLGSGRKADLEPGCNLRGTIDDLLLVGSSYQLATISRCFYGTWRRVTGYAAPIVVFIVRDVIGFKGCSLGPLTDYVVIEAGDPKCIAHELGHACNLWHSKKDDNLMKSNCCGTLLNWWQKILLRISRHVTYF
ncbi:hypothetical protein ACFLYS_01085 [Chloroflexota bacterium]